MPPIDKYLLQNSIRICNEYSQYLSRLYGIENPPKVGILPYSRLGKCVALGYYDADGNIILMNKYVLLCGLDEQRRILQHELIHALSHQRFGHGGHGVQFNRMCDEFHIDDGCKGAIAK